VEFIAIAERQGLITPLGYFVLERACRFIQRLKQNGHSDQHVGVNISVLQLVQEDFPKRVAEILAETGTAPEQIQLEITESVIIEDFAGADARLQPLRALGVSIALDDFGTGYSALSRLEELPIDCIKIDKRFIDNMMEKDRNRLFIKDLISMCHKMGLEVVAEGVEHERQLRYLAESDCDIMQGYYHSRPMVEEDALAQLAS
jgi:EAL domain-containing protein (putative c-di-GMP-specific phosphodiesterase class I)